MAARDNGMEQALNQAVAGKLEELRQLDERIDKRIEHLGRTEQNLRLLFDSLRAQVLQAHPLIGQLNQMRQQNAEMLESLVAQVQQRIDAQAGGVQAPLPMAAADDSSNAQLQASTEAHLSTLSQRARQLDEEVNAMVQTARQFIEHSVATAQQSAVQVMGEIDQKLAETRAAAGHIAPPEPAGVVVAAEEDASAKLDQLVGAFTQQADATLDAVRRSVAQHVELLKQQAKLEVRPILSQIEEQRRAAETQVSAAVEAAEATLARRADELKRNAERMMELCEQQLVDRIANIRPRARAAIDSIEYAAQQRLAQGMAEMERAVARAEARAAETLEAMRPRTAEIARQIEQDLKDQLKRMEDDAVASTHWLEHRLQRRMDEMTRRLTAILAGEIERVEDAPEPRRGGRAASPVEVQIMVEPTRHGARAEAAA